MRIERVEVKDQAQKLYEMDIEAFCRDFDYPARNLNDVHVYLKNCEVYFVYEENDLIGTFSYKEKNNEIEIMQVIVLPQFQKKGFGKKIVKEILKLVKGKRVWLATHPKNVAALITYLKAGFVIQEWKENYFGDGQPKLLLSLEIVK